MAVVEVENTLPPEALGTALSRLLPALGGHRPPPPRNKPIQPAKVTGEDGGPVEHIFWWKA